MNSLPPPRATLRDLLRDVLAARALPVPAQSVAARTAALRHTFDTIDRDSAAEAVVMAALPRPRAAGWQSGVLAALDLIVGVPPRSSRIAQALMSSFGGAPPIWRLDPVQPALSRAEGSASRAATADGRMVALVDDTGPERRIVVTIRDAPGTAPPVMLLIDRADATLCREIDPEIIEPDDIDGNASQRLRYEAAVEPGSYRVVFGNPRRPCDDGT